MGLNHLKLHRARAAMLCRFSCRAHELREPVHGFCRTGESPATAPCWVSFPGRLSRILRGYCVAALAISRLVQRVCMHYLDSMAGPGLLLKWRVDLSPLAHYHPRGLEHRPWPLVNDSLA
jgi:hypothetical protein